VLATGGKTFTYDSQNELVGMSSGTTSVAFIYDAFGNRVGKSVNGVITRYLVDDLNLTGYPQVMEELNGSGVVTRTYTYGLQRISEEQVISGAWTPSFYGYDGGGNVRQLTNSGGTVTDSYEYDAYGNSWTVSGTTPNNYLYRGEQYDPDLGLYYLRARYYNPLTGRFMSRDPEDGKQIDPRTLHKYLYAGGDPVNFLDPRGRDSILEVGAIDRDFLLDTVPAVVAFVGDFVVLQAIPFTVDAATTVAEFLADAWEVVKADGVLRYLTCMEFGSIYASAIVNLTDSDAPPIVQSGDKSTISAAFQKVCGFVLFNRPIT
jgi:RHS repeat-associated protein